MVAPVTCQGSLDHVATAFPMSLGFAGDIGKRDVTAPLGCTLIRWRISLVQGGAHGFARLAATG